ncbi:MAG: hypothetical protein FWG14_03895 [Peptococcaceae bacterium]|nr:hypothetical protein [Peptococcaceae bacterium]
MLTQERAAVLTEILNADEARAQTLLALEPDEAVKQINALGNDFTVDELCEYGEKIQAASKQGELDADSLDNVAGGVWWPALLGGAVVAGGAGVAWKLLRRK